MAKYSLGSGDAELARLRTQAEFLDRPTRLLLEASGIGPGMRVLDLGTGLGHLAAAASDLVGADGEVVGIDLDPRMLELAQARFGHLPQVRFVEGDAKLWRDNRQFDALMGRLILFHLPDPVGALRHHLEAVRPGGRVVILDYDIGGLRTEPNDPMIERMTELVMTAFRAAGADPTIGSRLQSILAESAVEDVEGMAAVQYLAHDDPLGPEMLAGVVRSLAPVMIKQGLATEAELDLDTLSTRVADALRARSSVLVPPILVGAWGRRP